MCDLKRRCSIRYEVRQVIVHILKQKDAQSNYQSQDEGLVPFAEYMTINGHAVRMEKDGGRRKKEIV